MYIKVLSIDIEKLRSQANFKHFFEEKNRKNLFRPGIFISHSINLYLYLCEKRKDDKGFTLYNCAWPSLSTIQKNLGIKNRNTLSLLIQYLEFNHIITTRSNRDLMPNLPQQLSIYKFLGDFKDSDGSMRKFEPKKGSDDVIKKNIVSENQKRARTAINSLRTKTPAGPQLKFHYATRGEVYYLSDVKLPTAEKKDLERDLTLAHEKEGLKARILYA